MAKRTKPKKRNKRVRRRGAFAVRPTFSACHAQGLIENPPPGAFVVGPEELALMGHVATVIDEFEYEVSGGGPSAEALLLVSPIARQLREGGIDADFERLDVERALDLYCDMPEGAFASLHCFMTSFVTWLYHNGFLAHRSANEMLQRLYQREPPLVAMMRAAIAALPREHRDRTDREQRARHAELRARHERLN